MATMGARSALLNFASPRSERTFIEKRVSPSADRVQNGEHDSPHPTIERTVAMNGGSFWKGSPGPSVSTGNQPR